MAGNSTVELIATRLAAALPGRLVTRNALDFAQRSLPDRQRGVLTLVTYGLEDLKNVDAFFEVTGRLRMVLLAEFELPEKSTGQQVEAAEWALVEAIRNFARAPGPDLCPLEVLDIRFSAQQLVPVGYVSADLEYAELD